MISGHHGTIICNINMTSLNPETVRVCASIKATLYVCQIRNSDSSPFLRYFLSQLSDLLSQGVFRKAQLYYNCYQEWDPTTIETTFQKKQKNNWPSFCKTGGVGSPPRSILPSPKHKAGCTGWTPSGAEWQAGWAARRWCSPRNCL